MHFRPLHFAVPLLALTSGLPALALAESFARLDSNCDNAVDLSDGVYTLEWLFLGGSPPCCLDGADANDDGRVDTSDAIFSLDFLFRGGPRPRAPFPGCGTDPTADTLTCVASPCSAEPTGPELTEWTVPWSNTRPRDPYVGPQGLVWFVGQRGNYVGSLNPVDGEFKRFELDPAAAPHNLIVSDVIWYAGNGDSHIGRLDPTDGTITRFEMPNPTARDPHTLVFDGNGDIWFTVQGGNFVGKLTVASGEIQLQPVPTAGARPYGIVVNSQDVPWVAEFGTHKLARVDPATLEITEFPLPRSAARPRRLVVTSDDAVWYVDHSRGFLGRLDPTTGDVEEWQTPGGTSSRPYGMAVDDRDRLWFVESGPSPNRFVGFDSATKEFVGGTDIESGGGTVRHMFFDPNAREMWFGTDANTIGRAVLD